MKNIAILLAISSIVSMLLIAYLNIDQIKANPFTVIVPGLLGIIFLIIFIKNHKKIQL